MLPAAALVLLASCGLPGIQPSIAAPVVPAAASDPNSSGIFTFNNGPQSSPNDFYGFEIYYKLYDDSSGNASTLYQGDVSQLSTTLTGPSQLVALGYRRAYLYPPGYTQGDAISSPTTPLIPITDTALKTTSFQVSIDFTGRGSSTSANQDFYPAVSINGQPMQISVAGATGPVALGRYLGIPTGSNINLPGGTDMVLGFGYGDFALDQGTGNGGSPAGDIPSSLVQATSPNGAGSFVLGLFAIGYGLVDLTTPIYSVPTPLGYISYVNVTLPTSFTP